MNKPLKWGLGWLCGVLAGNLFWLFAFKSPTASFFTAGWWEVWPMAYCVGIVAVLAGLARMAVSAGSTAHRD